MLNATLLMAVPAWLASLDICIIGQGRLCGDSTAASLMRHHCSCRIRDALPESPSSGQGYTMSGSHSMQEQLAALQTAQQYARFREAALLSLLAMLGGVMLANRGAANGADSQAGERRQSGGIVVKLAVGLALANGMLALLLQARDGWSLWNLGTF